MIFSGVSIILMSFVLYLISKEYNGKSAIVDTIKEKFYLDYLIYAFFILYQPGVSNQYIPRIMRSNKKSGLILIATIIWGGFLVIQFYKAVFLSFLTVPLYEKPIKDIPGTCSISVTD